MKKLLAMILALTMLLGALPLAGVAEAPAADGPATYVHDGRVTLIDGATVDTPVTGFDAAKAVIDGVLDQLGGDAGTVLEPWRDIADACGNRYYIFQQMYNNTTVLGGAVKVITDPEGNMLGLTASIEANPEEVAAAESITGEQAEAIVLDHAMQTTQQALTVLEGLTDRMILPIAIELDVESIDYEEGSRYVWVVYTDNPDSSLGKSSDLPYLAHYVAMTGEYLYSLPTIIPNDEAGSSGFDASYVFEFMESVNYTGYVDLSDGTEKEISVDVMRDKRTGMYYLGNLERRIVIGQCWPFLYGGNRVVLEYSPDNLEWDQTGLCTLYNYCQAYDYYKAIGWIGGDGLGTPILVLNNYCDANHTPVDNAAYAGGYLGWQMFLASSCNDFSQCLDILAHEFTHCVTGSVMTYNAYMNDYGAINEAMSDIQGKTCEMLMEGAENTNWTLGNHSEKPVRDMEAPHKFKQPEHTWDIYYTPNVKTPTILNDRGGVHTNSSLLNCLACYLYTEAGMTLEEGRAFWFTVDCAMVPGTDYAQLAEILPWALKAAGLDKYEADLTRALDITRLGVDEIPDTFDEDRALVTLRLPEGGCFDDEQWVMYILTLDVNKLIEKVRGIVAHVMMGDYSDLPEFVQQMLTEAGALPEAKEQSAEDKGFFDYLLDALLKEEPEENRAAEALERETADDEEIAEMTSGLIAWAREFFSDVLYAGSTNAGQDGHTMRVVSTPGYTLPVLIHGVYNDNTSSFEDSAILVLIGDSWIDFDRVITSAKKADATANADAADAVEIPEELQAIIQKVVDGIFDIHGVDDAMKLLFFHVQGGAENELPAAGLDAIQPMMSALPSQAVAGGEVQPKKSRPKIEATPEEGAEEAADIPNAA